MIMAIAQLGWFSLVLGLYYLVLNLVLSADRYPMPRYSIYMIAAGIAMIIFFSKQEGKFFKGLLKGVGGLITTFIDSIGSFSDIISYIRLFAVGLATVEIAKSFNSMAAGMGDGVIGIVGGAIILIFGHGLNLAMGALSVIVHGVRLNMLEFSGHLGMEWTGVPYTPFTIRERQNPAA
jgi:V/A-type H+-transporting ATPase subunit I